MSVSQSLKGVFAAVVTPVRPDYSCAVEEMAGLLHFLAQRGCHGALLLGTTGEGPSFAAQERLALMGAALEIRQEHPDFRLLAGTGTPSLEETILLTRGAFDLGYDGVVVLPPYYFRNAPEGGLFEWFKQVLERSVPGGGALLAYHIPPISGVPISIELLTRLKDAFSTKFAGLKDSSGDPEHAIKLGETFGSELVVLTGNDRLFSLALQAKASGGITALANLASPLLRLVWEHHLCRESTKSLQAQLDAARHVMECFPPPPTFVKSILSKRYNFPAWTVRPPLMPMPHNQVERATAAWVETYHD
jgi:4-hydroxy-tetrahydrodipicolinate synthase